MKKIVLSALMTVMVVSCAFAMPSGVLPYGVGAKYAAMGGTGVALVDDIYSGYYNPAGMSGHLGLKVGAGTASTGSDQLMNVLGNMSNPAKFLADNFSKSIDVNGNLDAFVGLTAFGCGLSAYPVSNLRLVKNANTLGGTLNGNVNSDTALTLVRGAGLPFVGDVSIGANLKYIYNANAGVAVAAGATNTTMTNTVNTYTGMGYDLGVQGNITAIPMLPVSFGVVYKDFGASLTGNSSVSTSTYKNSDGSFVSSTPAVDTPIAGYSVPTTLSLGAATKVPVIGTQVEIDLDSVSGTGTSYSVTHIGAEYPILMGLIALRAGTISGGPAGAPISMTTYGAGLFGNMVNIAMVSDNNNSLNNQTMADVGFSF